MTDSPIEPTPAAAPVPHPTPAAAPTNTAPTTPTYTAPAHYTSATPPPPLNAEEHPVLAKQPKRNKSGVLIAALAIGALIGGVSGAGVGIWAVTANGGSGNGGASAPTSITVNDSADATTITAVAVKASPSVVTINVAGNSGNNTSSSGTGSGVILSNDGYILTNTHVVTLDGASADAAINVETSDGRLLSAELVGTDPIYDLAVIKVDGVTNLTPAEFADSSKLNVGDTAIAIGAPLGLAGTVTNGIVSALNRSITVASSAAPEDTSEDAPDSSESPFDFWNFDLPGEEGEAAPDTSGTISLSVIQTDAAINPGNSGGALLDDEGKVIGINVAIASAGGTSATAGSIGVGFAIPGNAAQRIAQEIIDNGFATHGLLGAGVQPVEASSDGSETVVGALLAEISEGGAAEAAGLQEGDIVTQLNGIPITNPTDLTAQVRILAAGTTVEVTYVRNGTANTVEATLGELEQ